MLRIVETPAFTRRIATLLDDQEYSRLQLILAVHPTAGDLVPRSGGLRKLRWRLPGHGKRGGLRVIYYWISGEDVVYMLYAYAKVGQEDVSPEQLRALRRLLREL